MLVTYYLHIIAYLLNIHEEQINYCYVIFSCIFFLSLVTLIPYFICIL